MGYFPFLIGFHLKRISYRHAKPQHIVFDQVISLNIWGWGFFRPAKTAVLTPPSTPKNKMALLGIVYIIIITTIT